MNLADFAALTNYHKSKNSTQTIPSDAEASDEEFEHTLECKNNVRRFSLTDSSGFISVRKYPRVIKYKPINDKWTN